MRQWTVDAFAAEPFRGNGACVVEPFEGWPTDIWMQALAEENKQAETAYLRRTEAPDVFDLRWFTPTLEVALCGHATLAAAHVMLVELGVDTTELRFRTRQSGDLIVRKSGHGYEMDFPASASRPVATPPGLAETLGAEPRQVFASGYLLVELDDETTVRQLAPDIPALSRFGREAGLNGNIIVCAEADAGRPYRVVSRFFAPASGVPEDAATGSAHCILAPVWAAKLGRLELDFHQAYPGRGADLHCRMAGERVLISGRAVTVMETRLRL